MPFIIWGSTVLTSTKESGTFYCPACDRDEEFTLKQARPFFTLYFIPLIPTGSPERYVECRACKGTFQERVLEMEKPTEQERFLGAVYGGVRNGRALDDVKQDLLREGMSEEHVEKILLKMCDGPPATCRCGQRFHSTVTRCSECGMKL